MVGASNRVFNITGIQGVLNVLSSVSLSGGGLFLIIALLAIIGMFAALRDLRLSWSAVVLIVAAIGYYISITQNNMLFKFGNTSFLGLGFWVTLAGAVISISGIIVMKRKK